MTNDKTEDASTPPVDLSVMPCPFCGGMPKQYRIGERPMFGEKGEAMVRCESGSCGLYGKAISLSKWQVRYNKI